LAGSNPISGTIFAKWLNLRLSGQIAQPILAGSNPISGTIFCWSSIKVGTEPPFTENRRQSRRRKRI
jgi:hypothetical protein